MRVAVDVRSLMEGRQSGVEVYTTALLRALTIKGSDVRWQLFYNSLRPVRMPEFPHVTWQAFHWPNKLFNAVQGGVAWPAWDTLVSADVFFMPNMRLMPLKQQALVVTVHDLSFERFPEFYSARGRLWHRLMQPRQLFQRADHVIAVSQATKEDVVELYGVEPERITVIHSGAALPAGRPLAAWREAPDRFILYLGTLEPRKNVVSLVEAFSAIAGDIEQDLVIAGSPGWLMKPVERAIRLSPARARIHRLGFVPDAFKASLYAAADLFVYPSFYEGFGFPPLEALLAGTPVVASNNSSLPEVVGQWATMVDPYKPGELALVIKELLREPVVVSEEIKMAIRQKFNWSITAQATLDILFKYADCH